MDFRDALATFVFVRSTLNLPMCEVVIRIHGHSGVAVVQRKARQFCAWMFAQRVMQPEEFAGWIVL
jgi:hypothetical protein